MKNCATNGLLVSFPRQRESRESNEFTDGQRIPVFAGYVVSVVTLNGVKGLTPRDYPWSEILRCAQNDNGTVRSMAAIPWHSRASATHILRENDDETM